MLNKKLYYNDNLNGQLLCHSVIFLRPAQSFMNFEKGDTIEVYFRDDLAGEAEIISTKAISSGNLSEIIAHAITGHSLRYYRTILSRIYGPVANTDSFQFQLGVFEWKTRKPDVHEKMFALWYSKAQEYYQLPERNQYDQTSLFQD